MPDTYLNLCLFPFHAWLLSFNADDEGSDLDGIEIGVIDGQCWSELPELGHGLVESLIVF